MSLAAVSPGRAAALLALCVTLTSSAVAGQTAAGAATVASSSAAPSSGPLKVWVDAPSEAFDKASLRASLARELGREVVLTEDANAAVVQIRLEGPARADVRYTTPGGQDLSRSVELPPDQERAVLVVSWLTVNLVRDEASELLDQLRARRRDEADARAAEQAAADKAAADKAAADKTSQSDAKRAPPVRDDLLRDPLRSLDVGLATPLSLLRDSPRRELRLQLALGYGESGAIAGIAISPGVLRVRRDLRGIAVGTGAAFVGSNARGVMVSAGYAQLDGNLDGVQIGAGAAVQRGDYARGLVLAVGGAVAGDVNGAIVGAGFASAKSVQGAAVAVGATFIRGPSEGVLVAGGGNFSTEHRGVEIAAGVNGARTLRGIAIASINAHRRVKGLQIGLLNVAEQVDGAAIGLLSLAKNGRLQPLLWSGTDGSLHLALKSIAGYAFTQLGGGINLAESELTYDGGVGVHLRLGQSFFLEPGVHYSASHDASDASGAPDEQQLHYLAQLGWRVANKLDLLAAAGARHTFSGGSGAAVAPEGRLGIGFF